MGVRKILSLIVLMLLMGVLTSCGGEGGSATATPAAEPSEVPPTAEPTEAAQEEPTERVDMVRGNVFIDKKELQVMESDPVQLSLSLAGNLPTPCHQLQYEVSGAEEEGEIRVEVWSVAPADQECIQVLEAFEESISLGTAKEGSFSVFVNGEEVGQVDL